MGGGPSVRYLPQLFDSKQRVFLDIALRPADRRCLACHSVAPAQGAKVDFDEDVHTSFGLLCVDCHRNGLDHDMVRGDEAEAASHPYSQAADFTCAGCHLGREPEKGGRGWSGRLGAPYPRHAGIPPVHFQRLTCTVCHSGPLPADEPLRVRTSRANRLGIFGIARWATDRPVILEAVPRRNASGKIAPHRLMWPAYWAEERAGVTLPLAPERVLEVSGGVLDASATVAAVLDALAGVVEAGERPALLAGGKRITTNLDGELAATPLERAGDPTWSILRPDGTLRPLFPKLDPAGTPPDAESAARIQAILEALATVAGAPGRPILRFNKVLYRVVNGSLQCEENAGPPVSAPQLGWLSSRSSEPLVPDIQWRAAIATVGSEQLLTEEQVQQVLRNLIARRPGKYFYVSNGKLFRLNQRGELTAAADQRAEAVAWPLAHRVRPARQALGVNGCGDCHRSGSPFFFAKVRAAGPLLTAQSDLRLAVTYMKLNSPYQHLFGLSFAGRPLLKWLLFACILVAGAVLFLALFIGVGRLTGLIERRR